MDAPARDPGHDAVAALERLYAKQVITREEGEAAARFLTGDAGFVFPPPKPASPPQEGGAPPTDRASE